METIFDTWEIKLGHQMFSYTEANDAESINLLWKIPLHRVIKQT